MQSLLSGLRVSATWLLAQSVKFDRNSRMSETRKLV